MSSAESTGDRSGKSRGEPRRVRLPGFINDEDIGLGDVAKRATSIVGIKPCGGCSERARWLNNRMVFSKRR
ncbi:MULTISPECIES: hypothetical protein [Streptomyces]|uniref:hypothetical protein n=1 Tax=Streptomyces TaxID=1883 RepID=UPI0024A2FCD1|nr:hypothetical protein Slala03_81620 [Streptomyces lavendulae subsp. lavendulae]